MAINKIQGWEELEIKESGEGSTLPVGIYKCKIVSVENVPSKEYIKVNFDIVEGAYKGYFTRLAQANNGVWVNQGIKYASYKETAAKFFRNWITALERSNQGYVFDWDENKWVGKVFVGVFGEEEYINQEGSVAVSVKLRDARSTLALQNGDIKVPTIKKLKTATPSPVADTTFDISSEDLPF